MELGTSVWPAAWPTGESLQHLAEELGSDLKSVEVMD